MRAFFVTDIVMNEGLPHLPSQTKHCNVIEDVTVIVRVLDDLLHAGQRLFRLNCSFCNVVVPNLIKK